MVEDRPTHYSTGPPHSSQSPKTSVVLNFMVFIWQYLTNFSNKVNMYTCIALLFLFRCRLKNAVAREKLLWILDFDWNFIYKIPLFPLNCWIDQLMIQEDIFFTQCPLYSRWVCIHKCGEYCFNSVTLLNSLELFYTQVKEHCFSFLLPIFLTSLLVFLMGFWSTSFQVYINIYRWLKWIRSP